jgi:hypothetical protein
VVHTNNIECHSQQGFGVRYVRSTMPSFLIAAHICYQIGCRHLVGSSKGEFRINDVLGEGTFDGV